MSARPEECPPEVMLALARALADKSLRDKLADDAEGALRGAGVEVHRLPAGALDAIGSASDGDELDQLGEACRTVLAYSEKAGHTNCFL